MYMQTNQTKQTNQATTLQMEPVLPFQKHFDSELYTEHFNCVNMHNNKRNLHMFFIWIAQCITVFVQYFKKTC